jgi:hypothetical protein
MPLFLRRYVAREGREGFLRHELIRVHEELVPKAIGLLEVSVYREHVIGREFLSLAIYDDDASVAGPGRKALLEELDEIERQHGEVSGVPVRLESLYEYASIPQPTRHSAAAVLDARPEQAAALRARLPPTVATVAERLRPRRVIVAQGVERPEQFVVVGDSEHPFDPDRYLTSGFGRRQTTLMEPFLVSPPRYYVLDPVWRYFRGFSAGGTRG